MRTKPPPDRTAHTIQKSIGNVHNSHESKRRTKNHNPPKRHVDISPMLIRGVSGGVGRRRARAGGVLRGGGRAGGGGGTGYGRRLVVDGGEQAFVEHVFGGVRLRRRHDVYEGYGGAQARRLRGGARGSARARAPRRRGRGRGEGGGGGGGGGRGGGDDGGASDAGTARTLRTAAHRCAATRQYLDALYTTIPVGGKTIAKLLYCWVLFARKHTVTRKMWDWTLEENRNG